MDHRKSQQYLLLAIALIGFMIGINVAKLPIIERNDPLKWIVICILFLVIGAIWICFQKKIRQLKALGAFCATIGVGAGITWLFAIPEVIRLLVTLIPMAFFAFFLIVVFYQKEDRREPQERSK